MQQERKLILLFGVFVIIVWLLSLQTSAAVKPLFSALCHQKPDRCFSINGFPMAVCSRCFGFYSMLALAWFVPFLLKFRVNKKVIVTYFIFIIVINTIDVIFNMSGIWTNNLLSRFFMGMLLSLPIPFILNPLPSKTKIGP